MKCGKYFHSCSSGFSSLNSQFLVEFFGAKDHLRNGVPFLTSIKLSQLQGLSTLRACHGACTLDRGCSITFICVWTCRTVEPYIFILPMRSMPAMPVTEFSW